MKRKILIGGGVLAALLGTVLIVPSFIDWNKYKGQIVSQLEAATGHDYDIKGPIQLAILPFPHVAVDSLIINAPQDQGGAALLTLDKASVSVELVPLIQGRINIKSVTLEKPVITVSIAADGTPSWMTPKLKGQPATDKASPAEQKASMADSIVLQSVNIKDGSVRYQDMRTGSIVAADHIDLSINADSLFGPYAIEGSLVYNDEKIDIEGKSGRLGKGAGSTPLQFKADLPSSKTHLEFSGVAGLKDALDVQGETDFSTGNLAALMKPFIKSVPAGTDHPVQAKGLLTYSPDTIAFRNARFVYADAALAGSVAVTGLKQAQMSVNADLSSDTPVNVDALLGNDKNIKAPSAPGEAGAAPATLIPETLTLPADIGGKITVGLKTVTFKGMAFNDAGLSVVLSPRMFKGQFKSGLAGDGDLSGSFDLAYANAAKAGNAVTLSDPSMNYRMQLNTKDPRKLLGAFVSSEQLKSAGNLLASNMNFDIKGSLNPNTVKIEAGSLTFAGTPFAFAASYTPKATKGRDMVSLNVSTDTLDADAWIKRISPDRGQDAATRSEDKKPDVAAIAKSFRLPLDLDLAAAVKTLRYGQNDYGNVGLKGRLVGDTLTLDQAGFQDQAGNVLNISGSVGSLNALGGIDLSVSGKTPDADLLLKSLKVNAAGLPDKVGSAEGSAEFKGQADRLGFTTNIKVLRGTMEASGALADLLTTPSVSDLTFRLRHPSYVDLVRLYDPSFRGSVDIDKNLDLFTTMQRDGKVYTFKEIKATIGPASMTGELQADMGGKVPSVTASMQFGSLPLDKLLGAQATTGESGRVQATRIQPASDARWSRDAIDAGWMRKWNADVKTTADNVSYGNWQVSSAAMDFALKDGTLTLSKLNGGMYGGKIALSGKMAAPSQERQPLDMAANVALDNVSLESFVQSFSGSKLLRARGTISLDSTMNATGISPAALIFDLGGKGTLKGNNLEFQGFDLAKMSRTFAQPSSSWKENFGSLLNASVTGGTTKFDTLDGAFTISEGVINFDKMKLEGTDATVSTAGTVNLPLWTVNLESTITLPEPKDNPPPPLKVAFKGPLDNPAQTFGKSALEGYFMQQYGNKLQDQLLEQIDKKLDKKGGALGEVGKMLPGLLGVKAPEKAAVPAAAETAPAQQQAVPTPAGTAPEQVETIEPAATTTPAPEAASQQPTPSGSAPVADAPPQEQPKEKAPEEQIKDFLNGVMGQ